MVEGRSGDHHDDPHRFEEGSREIPPAIPESNNRACHNHDSYCSRGVCTVAIMESPLVGLSSIFVGWAVWFNW